jgi:ABC-2 type transport system ATP-binding protein
VPILSTKELVKQYGAVKALQGVSLAVAPGEIFGLLGQNGAGKTTLIKILLGITRLTAGSAELLGQPVGAPAVRRRIGYLPEDHRFPEYHTGHGLLEFYGGLLGLSATERRLRIPAALERVGLDQRMHSKIRTYSKGMKQRLGIAQAIFHDPELIFLDEPTDGVDPVGRRQIRDLMQELRGRGKTLFVNSHLLGEVEQVCDRVAILQHGHVVREGSIAALTQQKGLFVVGLAPGQTLPVEQVRQLGYEVKPAGERWEVVLAGDQTIDAVIDLLHRQGLNLRHLVEKRESLEDLYLKTLGSEPAGDEAPRRPPTRQRREDARSGEFIEGEKRR